MLVRLAVLLVLVSSASAEIRLPRVFSDHAVLQRNQPIRLWGWSDPGEKITVQIHGQTISTVAAADGTWNVSLRPEEAGGPFTLKVFGSTSATVIRKDILVGDVWIASGQSNMEFPLRGWPMTPNSHDTEAIADATHPEIRLLREGHNASPTPMDDLNADWMLCTPENAQSFSAVAYFFAVQIQGHEHVPIGIISDSWGGTPALAWINRGGITEHHLDWATEDAARAKRQEERAAQIAAMHSASDIDSDGDTENASRRIPGNFHGSHYPSFLFNGMIAPLTRVTIKGVIWYQGEAEQVVGRPKEYRQTFPALIESWRKEWHEGDFPFLFVQLPGYAKGQEWGWIRDAQRRALSVSNTAMVTTLDIGAKDLLHPPDKLTVGIRLALAAREVVYAEEIEGVPPLFRGATVEGRSICAYFTHAEGLTTRGQPVGGFEVAGEDANFFAANARIENRNGEPTVVASSPSVPSPRYIRYGWTGWVDSYLWNADGLPMATFTSQP